MADPKKLKKKEFLNPHRLMKLDAKILERDFNFASAWFKSAGFFSVQKLIKFVDWYKDWHKQTTESLNKILLQLHHSGVGENIKFYNTNAQNNDYIYSYNLKLMIWSILKTLEFKPGVTFPSNLPEYEESTKTMIIFLNDVFATLPFQLVGEDYMPMTKENPFKNYDSHSIFIKNNGIFLDVYNKDPAKIIFENGEISVEGYNYEFPLEDIEKILKNLQIGLEIDPNRFRAPLSYWESLIKQKNNYVAGSSSSSEDSSTSESYSHAHSTTDEHSPEDREKEGDTRRLEELSNLATSHISLTVPRSSSPDGNDLNPNLLKLKNTLDYFYTHEINNAEDIIKEATTIANKHGWLGSWDVFGDLPLDSDKIDVLNTVNQKISSIKSSLRETKRNYLTLSLNKKLRDAIDYWPTEWNIKDHVENLINIIEEELNNPTQENTPSEYFVGLRTVEEYKAKFRELSLKLHPDRGGNQREFQDMFNEYNLKVPECPNCKKRFITFSRGRYVMCTLCNHNFRR